MPCPNWTECRQLKKNISGTAPLDWPQWVEYSQLVGIVEQLIQLGIYDYAHGNFYLQLCLSIDRDTTATSFLVKKLVGGILLWQLFGQMTL